MIYNLSTEQYRLQNALNLANSISTSNDYFFFVGDYVEHSNTQLQPVYDITNNTVTQAWRNMIQGVQIGSNAVYSVINNVQWAANTVYARYDDQDAGLPEKQFFAITNEGSYYHIWKCLDNNFGAPSTVQPLFAYVNPDGHFIQLADLYCWKYMTSVPLPVAQPFLTSNYFPVVSNTSVQQVAIPGAIDIFAIESNGAFYNNYISGSFVASDIAVNGNPVLYNISNSVAQDIFNYYTGCILYLSSGTGEGQFANIINYVANTTGNILELDVPFQIIPQNGTTYQVMPKIAIVSDGLQTSNCFAIAQINALASNSVYGVNVLQSGVGYQYVQQSNVVVSNAVGISNTCLLRPILPPQGGHGSNVYSELYSNSIAIYAQLVANAGGLLTTNDYQQIGLMYSPAFANVVMTLNNTNGSYDLGEEIYSYNATQLNSGVAVTGFNANITCNTANFTNQLQVGQNILITNQGNTLSQLVQVANVVNSSFITLNQSMDFSCSSSVMYSLTITGSALVTIGGGVQITVTDCTPNFVTGTLIVGSLSGTMASVNTISRSGNTTNFALFNNLTKLNVQLQSGQFLQDETIVQANTGTTATVFSTVGVANAVTIYCSEIVSGPFALGPNVVGSQSGAIAKVTSIYYPDIIQQSADILYLENINAITRANSQTESFVIVLNF